MFISEKRLREIVAEELAKMREKLLAEIMDNVLSNEYIGRVFESETANEVISHIASEMIDNANVSISTR